MAKTINVTGKGDVTFVMPDDNVTLQPVFGIDTGDEDVPGYTLDYTTVGNGTIPEGWRTTDGTDIHEYPNSFGSGARVMVGFGGYQGKGLYWRNTSAEYGQQSAFPLNLEPGSYKFIWAMAAWKGTPKYKASILSSDTGSTLITSAELTATPNADGSTTSNLSTAKKQELEFTVSQKGKYIISFQASGGGYQEFLLLDCRVSKIDDGTGIQLVNAANGESTAVYDLNGRRVSNEAKGMLILRTADGKTRKIIRK
jgi:hypothetical protein